MAGSRYRIRPAAALAFIAYLTTPDAKAMFKAKGMDPS
jgi:ABC-type molybdate transport system substrate-binding protein